MNDKKDLRREFERRKPWITKFVIEGQEYGGDYYAASDFRLQWFQERFPEARNILELGSLEGGHSFAIASWPHVERVVSIEGRRANLRRARFVQSVLKQEKVHFVRANLERFDLSTLGRFDAVLCLGLLYHVRRPWLLLEKIGEVTSRLLLWTHYCQESFADARRGPFRGRVYYEWLFLREPLSSLALPSFWPVREDLLEMLDRAGFRQKVIIQDDPAHVHGPAITIAAERE